MFAEFVSINIMWFAAIFIIAILLVVSYAQGHVKGAKMVSALELPQLQRSGNSVIIDVNESKDYSTSHIPDAINFNLEEINTDNAKLLNHINKTVIVVCQTGNRSAKAARSLIELGFNDVHILRGGLFNWTKENLPVTSS